MTATHIGSTAGVQPVAFVVYTRVPPSAQLSSALIRRGHSVLERRFSSGTEDVIHDLHPDIIVACLDPRDESDRAALAQLAHAADDAVLLVVGPGAEDDTVMAALNAGADACLPIQLSADVVAAQADALLRAHHRAMPEEEPSVVTVRDLVIDFARRRVTREGKILDLTRTEFDILGVLARNPGRVISPSEILSRIGQFVSSEAQARVIVKVHISHLRQKLEAGNGESGYLETVRGVGYLLERREVNAGQVGWAGQDDDYVAGTA